MSGLLRKLAIYLCSPIYKLIKYVYYIFYNLANTRFLNSEIISQFSSNIYVLVSVVMLFAFSVVILSAIVNPDLLSDNKKGVTALFKRSILALFLMVLVPFMFNILYKLQSNIMDNSLIEKIIVGTNISCQQDESESADDSTTDDTSDTVDESESKCKSGGNGGQVIAGTLISALVYPIEDNINVDEDVQKSYEAMIVEDIKHIGNFAEHINATTDGEDAGWLAGSDTNYAFVFNGLLAIVCGLGCVYILVIFSLDVAVRVFKLAFMELTAPISIVGYIAAGNKILSSWFQELVKTYVDLFIRITCIAFYLFLISNLSSFLEPFQNEDWGFVLKAFLVVGMLIFVKQVPDMISKIFGVDIKPKGGIGGRLGEMAGVGKQVQKAWNAVRTPLGAAGVVAGAVSGVGALASHNIAAVQNAKKIGGLKGALTGAAGVLTSGSAVKRAVQSGYKNRNLQGWGSAYEHYNETHPEGSTFLGRTADSARSFIGLKSRADQNIANLDKEKAIIDAQVDYNSSIKKFSKAISDAIKNSIQSDTSSIKFNVNAGNGNYSGTYSQIQERINAEKQAAAQILYKDAAGNIDLNRTNRERDAEFARIASVEQAVRSAYGSTRDALTTQALSSNTCPADIKDTDFASVKEAQSQLSARGVSVTTNDQLKNVTDNANAQLYTNNNSLTEQASRNEEQRRERNETGDFTEQGHKVQDSNAVKARSNKESNKK